VPFDIKGCYDYLQISILNKPIKNDYTIKIIMSYHDMYNGIKINKKNIQDYYNIIDNYKKLCNEGIFVNYDNYILLQFVLEK
jgi:hypothetical protein